MKATLTLNIHIGTTIQDAAHRAEKIATMTGMKVDFKINGVHVIMHPGSSPFDVVDIYHKSFEPGASDTIEAKTLTGFRDI